MMHKTLLTFALTISLVYGDGKNKFSAPAANSVVAVEKPYNIQWTPGSAGPVKIDLQDDSQTISITGSTPNTGSYEWTPSRDLAGKNNYFLRLCDLSTTRTECTYTFNGRFAIASNSTANSTISFSSRASSSSTSSLTMLSSSTSIKTSASTTSTTATTAPSRSPSATGTSTGSAQHLVGGLSTIANFVTAVLIAGLGFALGDGVLLF